MLPAHPALAVLPAPPMFSRLFFISHLLLVVEGLSIWLFESKQLSPDAVPSQCNGTCNAVGTVVAEVKSIISIPRHLTAV